MKLSSLASKQKRAKDWEEFVKTEEVSEELCARTVEAVRDFRAVLARCWEKREITEADAAEIADRERRLEILNEEARLVAKPPKEGVVTGRME